MKKILVYRFSAMGDVILLLPVLKGLLDSNEDIELYLLTQKNFFPFFENINRLHLVEVDTKVKHHGLPGLFRLFKSLSHSINPDYVFDLHGVIRTFFLDFLFSVAGFKVFRFDKGTVDKQKMIRSKKISVLPGTVDRYAAVFKKSGFEFNLPNPPFFSGTIDELKVLPLFKRSIRIGIAPFAKHRQKVWGINKIEALIDRLNSNFDADIVLFGGGKDELEILQGLFSKYPNCMVAAHHFKLADEIRVIKSLHVMVSMDSANMHMASMAGVSTVSIWGATHPAFGFAPYQQPAENMIQYTGNQLSCRPCSVYGNKKCIYNDGIRCMDYIPVDDVYNRIAELLDEKGMKPKTSFSS